MKKDIINQKLRNLFTYIYSTCIFMSFVALATDRQTKYRGMFT